MKQEVIPTHPDSFRFFFSLSLQRVEESMAEIAIPHYSFVRLDVIYEISACLIPDTTLASAHTFHSCLEHLPQR